MIGIAILSRMKPSSQPSPPPPPPSVLTRLVRKVRSDGPASILPAIRNNLRQKLRPARPPEEGNDHHIWHPDYEELLQLLQRTHFAVEKLHWQKPPHDFCIYLMARKA